MGFSHRRSQLNPQTLSPDSYCRGLAPRGTESIRVFSPAGDFRDKLAGVFGGQSPGWERTPSSFHPGDAIAYQLNQSGWVLVDSTGDRHSPNSQT
ncbi:hypothetical protein NG796_16695 [Laspinema sp. A4]|uniref:hypothetical protein n=1 Tax=Laspinema sp. D2d TaxID=2953686 RepID=UPI0021BBA3EB|nr:hypothetical protein [Laspinema sp. D2d]MCT7984911.1 hypothetical protein [Laspinema sp. D2d]